MRVNYPNIFHQQRALKSQFDQNLIFYPNMRESAGIVVDTSSFARNSVLTTKAITPIPAALGAIIGPTAILGGALGAPVGLTILREAALQSKERYRIGFHEGAYQSAAWGLCGASYAGLSAVLAAYGGYTAAGKAIPAWITPAFGYMGIAMSAGVLGYSILGFKNVKEFERELKTVQKEGSVQRIISWLNTKVFLTQDEIDSCQSSQEVEKALQRKWAQLEIQLGKKCATYLRENLGKFAQNFDEVKAIELIGRVEKANFKEKVKHITLFVIGVLSTLAFVFLLTMTGPLPYLLFAVGAIFWLMIDSSKLHDFIGEKCWALHSKAKEVDHLCQQAIPMKS